MEFNYKAGYDLLAEPMFNVMPKQVHQFIDLVRKNADVVKQDILPEMKQFTQSQKTENLARWAIIVFFWGHWSYGPNAKEATSGGVYWKVAYAFEQEICSRLTEQFPILFQKREYAHYVGVQKGKIHLYYSSPREWRNSDVALATVENMKIVQKIINTIQDHELAADEIKKLAKNHEMSGWFKTNHLMMQKVS